MSKAKRAETIAEYESALNRMIDEYEALETKYKGVQGRLDALMSAFDANGALGVLQSIAHDKTYPPELRARAAAAAVPYEKPKLSMAVTTTVPLFDLLEARRLKGKVIEHAPPPEPPTA